MSDIVTLARRISNVDVSPQFTNYSKVVINVSDDTVIEVGDDTGRTLTIDNPFGTQAMAEKILASLSGYQYQPYTADGALLDPRAEIGDAASMFSAYGGIYTRSRTFGRLMKADISAPQDEEIDHEYKFEDPTERKFRRTTSEIRASLILQSDAIRAEVEARQSDTESLQSQLTIQATEISAKVESSGGDSSSFGWNLTSDAWTLTSRGAEVAKFDANGATIKGVITATGGQIGGFTIDSRSLHSGDATSFSGTGNGVYIGPDGIRLGNNFKVDSAGHLTASSGTFTGSVRAKDIVSGGNNGFISGGAIQSYSIGQTQLTGASWGGISGGINFNSMMEQKYTASWICANHIICYGTEDGTISGTHYGSWRDDYGHTYGVSWKSKSFATGVSYANPIHGTGFTVRLSNGGTKFVQPVTGVNIGLTYDTIYYLGR